MHKLLTPANLITLAAYLAMMAAVTWGVFAARRTMVHRLDTPEAQAQWEAWRAAAEAQSRDKPRADEPPTLLLLRDHFALCLSGALLFSSLVFTALVVPLRGMLQQGSATGAVRRDRR